jgi:hypothetical protein
VTCDARRTIAACAAAIALIAPAVACATQIVDTPQLGVRFAVPAGWTGRELADGVLLGAQAVPGFVLLRPHEHRSLAPLKAEAQAGVGDGTVTALTLHGDLEVIGTHAIGGEFRGRIDGMPATAYLVGLVNPHGPGLTVLAATQPDKFTPQHREAALAVARSVEFYLPQAPSAIEQWREALANRRLARYASSYGSGSRGYSGFQSSTQLHLCAAGHFVQGSRESGSFDAAGAFGSTRGAAKAHGRWQVIANADGSPWLQLAFNGGRIENHKLEMQGGTTSLNGVRYFRGASNQCR